MNAIVIASFHPIQRCCFSLAINTTTTSQTIKMLIILLVLLLECTYR